MKAEYKKYIFSIVLIIILGSVIYSNSINGKFIWDDQWLVKDNLYIKKLSNIQKIFTRGIETGAGRKYYFYRPLQMVTYMVDYSLWELSVKGYHLSNIIFHILAAASLYWLVNILYGDGLLAFLTSTFFIVHPIHTEAISYISGRSDPLALLFMLLTIIFYIKRLHSKGIGTYLLMLLSYIFALLSREHSLILPVLLLLYHYTFKKRLLIKEFLPIVSITFIYILLRLTLLRSLLYHPLCSTTLLQRMPGFFVAITRYVRLLLFPFGLHMEYGEKLFTFGDPLAITGMAIVSSLIIYGVMRRKSGGIIFFSLSWFLITLLPVSNLYPVNAYMAEHWLYLPSIGFFLILAKGLSYFCRVKNLKLFAIVFTISLLTFYSYQTIRLNNYWKEPLRFYERALQYAPHSARVYNCLGAAYSAIGNYQAAIVAYEKAIERDLNYVKAYYNLGIAYEAIGKTDAAIVSYAKAIEINPNYAEAYGNLGAIYGAIGKRAEAKEMFIKAIENNPDYAAAYGNLAASYFYEKQYKLAIEYCDKAKELGFVNPDLLEALKPYRK